MKHHKVLVFSFEPFDGSGENASSLVAGNLKSGNLPMRQVVLPNDYGAVEGAIDRALADHSPTHILALGQSAGSAIRIERVALNMDHSPRPDRTGRVLLGMPIVPGAVAAYKALCDVDGMIDAVRAEGHMALSSCNPGGHMCNHAFFLLLHRASVDPAEVRRIAFIHVPKTTQQVLRTEPCNENAHYQPLHELCASVGLAFDKLVRDEP